MTIILQLNIFLYYLIKQFIQQFIQMYLQNTKMLFLLFQIKYFNNLNLNINLLIQFILSKYFFQSQISMLQINQILIQNKKLKIQCKNIFNNLIQFNQIIYSYKSQKQADGFIFNYCFMNLSKIKSWQKINCFLSKQALKNQLVIRSVSKKSKSVFKPSYNSYS
ncbi:hypothetical protein TTHERM_000569389 (macronuclear) [Tetrahymena thermophila SB210]|uniref:Uncharacterized protein n=1 Tax=Tetrahymena thermophila (strain SB210) TaxID=312017 RepID=W7WZL2_TETTS|nr:hypothetical protein TTHERM_000569389 [Tetrahymena thermophila SB210]EWS72290.1 hypothetical protein TTHERM_000569389 [Tetrahymena thermophila SB210]|eukprot:XP_012655230.1 hypothetical protein TTHERM_000569389 [Tetrahymena thermophila SB210]